MYIFFVFNFNQLAGLSKLNILIDKIYLFICHSLFHFVFIAIYIHIIYIYGL